MIRNILIIWFLFFTTANAKLTPASFSQLPGWEQDNHLPALKAFKKSCEEMMTRNPRSLIHASLPQYNASHWQKVCLAAQRLHFVTDKKARLFFEKWFVPYQVSEQTHKVGLFTGYYLPLLKVNTKPNKKFNVPIHSLPKDWVRVDLGLFMPGLSGKYVVGQIKKNGLSPYPRRETILNNQENTPVLFWGDNAIDVFFAQIQGSAMVQLPNGKKVLIGYAGANGRAYTSIGKILVDRQELDKETLSMQSIRKWLVNHPREMDQLFNLNASYVFFRILDYANPLGTEQVELTPERSLAIDKRFMPLGAPVWLSTYMPDKNQPQPFRHLMVTQDTGGAIRGRIRGDVYWGDGSKAEFMAGHMKSPGEYWLFLPRQS